MTIDKHGNKWRIRQMHDGHLYSITLDHKPTKTEAIKLMAKQLDHPMSSANMTFRDAAGRYIDSKHNILSPATIRGYTSVLSSLPEGLKSAYIGSITSVMVQTAINDIAGLKSPKTVANHASFIMTVLKAFDVDIKPPTLPQKVKHDPYIPTEDEVRAIFKAAEGTRWEVPFTLAALGLRRSEICALTIDDLEGCILHISKAKVPDLNNDYVVKGTKTTDSTRDIVIPAYIADRIRQQGYIYQGNPQIITRHLKQLQDDLGIQHFPLHKLRHFFASYMHHKGYTDKQIQEAGGWKTDAIMKSVYTHAMDMTETKKRMASDIGGLFSVD